MSQPFSLNLVDVVATARQTRKWVVVICPSDDQMMEVRKNLVAALNTLDKFSGRTAKLHGGGMISVACQDDEPFHREGKVISVIFMGLWSKVTGTDRMKVWRTAANDIL